VVHPEAEMVQSEASEVRMGGAVLFRCLSIAAVGLDLNYLPR
jgi:hypothetical protein